MISFIWAESKNGIIGNHGKIPWKEHADMHHFVKLTMHHMILSGLTTFKSYKKSTGLPHRCNLLLSKTVKRAPQGVIVFHNLQDFLKYAQFHSANNIMVCGGSYVYHELLPYVNNLYRTVINHDFKGDKYAMNINYDKFKLISNKTFKANKRNPYSYTFQTWQRK